MSHFVSPATIRQAAVLLRQGGVVAFPTETVYGLGANAFDPIAVARIFEIKNRPFFDPLIVHIAEPSWLKGIAHVTPLALKLIEKFWPGALTLVLRKKENIPSIVTAGLDTVAVRMPNHTVALEIIRQAGTPIAAPSANPFGRISPTTAAHVKDMLGEKIDLIVDGGPCKLGLESTIVHITDDKPKVLRTGALPLEEIEKTIGKITRILQQERPEAPGQLPQHYAPHTPLVLLSNTQQAQRFSQKKKKGLLAFRSAPNNHTYTAVEILSPTGNLNEAAANFFAALHRLDKAGLEVIFAEPLPEQGLGRAIMDRLTKAALKEPA